MPAACKTFFAACALFMLAACGGSSPAPEDEATAAAERAENEALGRDTDATVLDDMIQTQDRARAVEDLTLGRKDDLDQALEASGDDTPVDEE